VTEYPNIARKIIETAEKRRLKNLKATKEMLDLLEIIQLQKKMTLADLAGQFVRGFHELKPSKNTKNAISLLISLNLSETKNALYPPE
jgi:hypothetical protein